MWQQDLPLPQAKQAVSEVSVDGGKVRRRGVRVEGSHWRDYKAVRLPCLYYAAFFHDNQSLIDYVNTQPVTNPLVCLGDGHDGIWNLVAEFATPESRWEILDWYHLLRWLLKIMPAVCWNERFAGEGFLRKLSRISVGTLGSRVTAGIIFICQVNKGKSLALLEVRLSA